MANDLNQCQFIGRLGKDPETRYSTSGKAITSFSLAVGSQWKDKQTGEKQESTEWVNVTTFDKLAEICSEYLKKGSQIFISGQMKTDKYQDKETGADRYSTKIIANNMQMLSSKPTDLERTPQAATHTTTEPGAPANGGFNDDEGIPF